MSRSVEWDDGVLATRALENPMRRAVLVMVAVALAGPLPAQTRRAMTTDDGLDMVRVGGALMSPDGSWVLYSRSELDWD